MPVREFSLLAVGRAIMLNVVVARAIATSCQATRAVYLLINFLLTLCEEISEAQVKAVR